MGVPISFAEAVTAPAGTGTTLVPTIPSHQEDDVLIFQAGWKGNQAPTTLTGWTLYFSQSTGNASTGCGQGVWWRRVAPSETVTSPTLTIGTTAVERRGIVYCIRGADIDNPSNTFWQKQQTVGNSAAPTPPGITTFAPNYLLLHLVTCRGNSAITEPSGYTEEQDSAEGTTICINGSTKTQVTAESISGQAASISSNRWVAAIIAIPSPDYPYFRSQTSQTATSTSVTGTLPTGTTAADFYGRKDLIIATVEAAGTAPSPNVPADWTSIATWETTTSGGATTVRQYWALYDGSISLQFNRSGSGEISLNLSTYRNPHQTAPIGNVNVRQNASSTTSTWDALTRSATKSTVAAMCVADGTPTYTAPAGWTEREDGFGMTCADQIFEAGGNTASDSFTLSTASPTAAGLVEVLSHAGVAGPSEVSASGADSMALSDGLLLGQGFAFTDNAANLSDATTQRMAHLTAFADDVNQLTDAILVILNQHVAIDDALIISDDLVLSLEYRLSDADSVSFWDEFLQIGWGAELTDNAANWADELTFTLGGNVLTGEFDDALTWTDTFAGMMAHFANFDDSLSLADGSDLQLGLLLEFADQIVISDDFAQQFEYQTTFTDILTLTDEADHQLGHLVPLADAFLLADESLQQLAHLLAPDDSLALIDAYQLELHHLAEFAEQIALTDLTAEQMVHLLSTDDSFTLADDFSLQSIGTEIGLAFSDMLSQQDDVTLEQHHELTLAESLALTDALTLAAGEEVSIVDDLPLWLDDAAVQFHYHLPIADSFSLNDALTLFGEGFLQLNDALTIDDAAVVARLGPLAELGIADDLYNWQDEFTLSLQSPNLLSVTLGDSFTLADHYFDLRYPYIPSAKRHVVVPSRARTTVVPSRASEVVPGSASE